MLCAIEAPTYRDNELDIPLAIFRLDSKIVHALRRTLCAAILPSGWREELGLVRQLSSTALSEARSLGSGETSGSALCILLLHVDVLGTSPSMAGLAGPTAWIWHLGWPSGSKYPFICLNGQWSARTRCSHVGTVNSIQLASR